VDQLNLKMAASIQAGKAIKEDVSELKVSVKENQKRIRELEKYKWTKAKD